MAKASICIPLYGRVELTVRCLEAIVRCTDPDVYEVVLVDNASTDGTGELLDQLDGDVTIIRNAENLGFAKACNQAAEAATGSVVVFLNNDTEVQPGWLEPLVHELVDPEVGAVGARLVYPDGRLQHAGVTLVRSIGSEVLVDGVHVEHGGDPMSPWASARQEVLAVTGACLAMRRADFLGLGGFDEAYWNGNEDVDLCLKVVACGLKVVYQPRSLVVHLESASGPERWTATLENRRLLTRRWIAGLKNVPAVIPPGSAGYELRTGRAPSGLPGANVVGYFDAELGLGEAARHLLAALEGAGVPVTTTTHGLHWSRRSAPFRPRGGGGFPHPVNILCCNPDNLPGLLSSIGVEALERRYTIGFWFWELSEPSREMLQALELVDEVWVTSQFARRCLLPHTSKPITVWPMTVPRRDAPPKLDRAELGLDDRFAFGFMFDHNSTVGRKNPDGLIRAFIEEFDEDEPVQLYVKSVNASLHQEAHERLLALAATHCGVTVEDRYLPADRKDDLVAVVDCYVSLHRSEGFGLTIAEAMAAGTPVIATGYSGNLDFMDPSCAHLVPAGEVEVGPGNGPYPAGMRWGQPDLVEARRLMRQVVEDPEGAAQLGFRGQLSIRRTNGERAAAKAVGRRMREIGRALPTARALSGAR